MGWHGNCSRCMLQEATAAAGPTFNGQLLSINLLLAEYSSHNGIGPSAGLTGTVDLHEAVLVTHRC